MLRGVAWILGVLLAVGGCLWLYNRASGKDVPTGGDVVLRAAPSDSSSKETAATEADTAVNPSRDQAAPAATPTQAVQAAAPVLVAEKNATQTPSPQSGSMAKPAAAVPVSDSIAPNPPNGMAFAGSGKYQWYRQGNLTWRVDTQTGKSCIAFATDDEWRKPRVYSHGCGNA